MRLHLQAYVRCPDGESAVGEMAARIAHALPPHVSAALECTPKPSWNKPDLVRFAFDLQPWTAFDEIVSLLPEGWERSGMQMNKTATWVRADGQTFLIPEIEHASVDLVDASVSPPHVKR
jgi:hypothetical protein